MKLLELTISKFWGERQVSFRFKEDVNIFSGINGSGKTTILEIINSVLGGNIQDEDCSKKYESAQFVFSEGYWVDIFTIDGQKSAKYAKDGMEISEHLFMKQVAYTCVSSFDYLPYSIEDKKMLKEKYPWVRTELDYGLAMALQNYYMYIVSMNSQLRQAIERNIGKRQDLLKYFQDLSEMQDINDKLFAPSLKWDREADEVQFVLTNYGDKRINPHELSAGEKQMLVLLITTLVQRRDEFIVLWDEPELSMHVDWQKTLISTMQKINPNMQLIITTHSPFILYDGWENRVVNIQNIIK